MSDEPINPFLAAKRAPAVLAILRAADVLALRPDWTATQAADFLAANAAVIAHHMLEAGTAAAAQLAQGADHAN